MIMIIRVLDYSCGEQAAPVALLSDLKRHLVADHASAVFRGEGACLVEAGLFCHPAGGQVVGGDIGLGLGDSDGQGVLQQQGQRPGCVAAAALPGRRPVGHLG